MDTNALKKFAQSARTQLMAAVKARMAVVLTEGGAARREHPSAVRALEGQIRERGEAQVVEQVAYTWFNRFTALRFMDANGYTGIGVLSPAEGQTRPEVLAEAMAGHIDEAVPERLRAHVAALLDGRAPSSDPQGEAYRLLLVAACNQWHAHMPFLFEPIEDFTELLLQDDLLSQESLPAQMRAVMSAEACQDVEVIGWLYQFYISEKKDRVFADLKKNIKITAENIPAATQLFTPHWIVRYLVENSLGRLWLLNRPASKLAERMEYYIAPEEPETDFLRVGSPKEIKVCDPACGSGHMLTYAFDLLHAIYEEEGYDATEIPALILTHNLTGVEIDDRAGALAAFALVMKAAARLGRRRFLRMEVKPNIVVLQNVTFTPAEMLDVAAVVGRDLFTGDLRDTLTQFEHAKNFGSLVVPKLRDAAETLRVVEARDFGGDLLLRQVQARVVSVLRMAEVLSPKYHVALTNPPYMGSSGMNGRLADFTKSAFPKSKSDLFATFIERSLSLVSQLGSVAIVTIQNWMFLSSFEALRKAIINENRITNLLQIGYNSFPELNSKVVQAAAFVIDHHKSGDFGLYINLNDAPQSSNKEVVLRDRIINSKYYKITSRNFLKIPGMPIAYWINESSLAAFTKNPLLTDSARTAQGMATSDNGRFLRLWSEVSMKNLNLKASSRQTANNSGKKWFPYNKGGEYRTWYGNQDFVVNWINDGYEIRNSFDENGKLRSRPQNLDLFFLECASWSKISSGAPAFRYFPNGFAFDVAGTSAFFPTHADTLNGLGFLNSAVSRYMLSVISPTLNYEVGHISSLPFAPLDMSDQVADIVAFSKADWDAYETSWDFTALPLLSPDHRAETLDETYSRLCAHWQGTADKMLRLVEENNRIFIDAYGLSNELTPKVPINEIALTCNPAYRYGVKGTKDEREARLRADTMAEFLSYAVGCMFGRYSLDAPGLILANQGDRLEDYLARVPAPSLAPDADNVIPVLDADWFTDDITERFRQFLRVTFDEERFRENLAFIEAQIGDIRKYFTRGFYEDHLKRYKKRPIYWMFSSPNGTFQALIYMHRYRPETVSVLLNDYLREFIRKLEAERVQLEKQSNDPAINQGQRTKALKAAGVVAKQVIELTEWERDVIFPLAQQKIEIDLDDGVKANYPKFGPALKPIKGLEATDD
jgi:type II restriction/modification system DNA methylase subunit YeeA